jgi:hypothetical protein
VSKSLRRKPRRKEAYSDATSKKFWRAAVTRGGCVMCKHFPFKDHERVGREVDIANIQGHHILAKRHLRVAGAEHRFWDTRNGMALCSLHHHRHEFRMQPVPFYLVRDDALEFAAELGLLYVIENEYPGIEELR